MISRRAVCAIAAAATALAACQPGNNTPNISDPPAAAGSGMPHLAPGADGSAVLSWLEPDGNGHRLRFATLADDDWREAATVARGENWFVNWADFPSVAPIAGDFWAAHWLVKRPGGTYAYDVAVALSDDRGATWSPALTPHTDGTATEHGFVSLYPDGDAVGALWLDGREMMAESGHGSGPMTLRSAQIDGDGALRQENVVDGKVCDCCQTDVAVGGAGLVAAYRDRSDDEIRDIYVARSIGGRWQPGSPVARDNWRIPGCPVNGPAIAAAGDRVAVAWFTGANDQARVKVAMSTDGGETFGAPVIIDDDAPVGRVDVVLLDDGSVVTSWMAPSEGSAGAVMARLVRSDGTLTDPKIVAGATLARRAGFPQMLRYKSGLLFAWTDLTGDRQRVRATWVDADTLR
ncbi:MAG: sialidase family protein [Pseudomonadota bacterium]